MVHATLDGPQRWGYVFDKLAAAASFTYQNTPLCFFGHTHVPVAFIRDNMVRGGTPKDTELSPREKEIVDTIGPALRERGMILVGIDVIDGRLTEINVTSPTGIRAVKNLGGPDVAAKVWDVIEKKRGKR